MINRLLFFVPILLLFFLGACQNDSNTQSSADLNPLWNYEQDLIDKGQALPIEKYNDAIEKALSMRLPWAYSPLSIALRVAGQQMISPEVNLVAKSLSGNELITHAVVLVEKKSLQDDSILDQYYRVELKLGGSMWQVTQVQEGWKCKENRGDQSLSAEKCK